MCETHCDNAHRLALPRLSPFGQSTFSVTYSPIIHLRNQNQGLLADIPHFTLRFRHVKQPLLRRLLRGADDVFPPNSISPSMIAQASVDKKIPQSELRHGQTVYKKADSRRRRGDQKSSHEHRELPSCGSLPPAQPQKARSQMVHAGIRSVACGGPLG